MDSTYSMMPWMMGSIIFVIFVAIGCMFKAVFLPIRLFFAIIVPIAFVYGVCIGVYVEGWLDWLEWSSLHSDDGLVWMAPCITATILMGLALDYEIFLFSRVFEYRYKGYMTEAAIILAVSNTGPIISSAGTVMALAFFGMLLQNIVCSNQLGFLFVFGVLVDTFIIRPLLIPSMLSLVDALNWWPQRVPRKNLMDEYGKVIKVRKKKKKLTVQEKLEEIKEIGSTEYTEYTESNSLAQGVAGKRINISTGPANINNTSSVHTGGGIMYSSPVTQISTGH